MGEDGDFVVTLERAHRRLRSLRPGASTPTRRRSAAPFPMNARHGARRAAIIDRSRRLGPVRRRLGRGRRSRSGAGVSTPTGRLSETTSRSARSTSVDPAARTSPRTRPGTSWSTWTSGERRTPATSSPVGSTARRSRSATSSRSAPSRRASQIPTGIAMSTTGFVVTWLEREPGAVTSASSDGVSTRPARRSPATSRSTPMRFSAFAPPDVGDERRGRFRRRLGRRVASAVRFRSPFRHRRRPSGRRLSDQSGTRSVGHRPPGRLGLRRQISSWPGRRCPRRPSRFDDQRPAAVRHRRRRGERRVRGQ